MRVSGPGASLHLDGRRVELPAIPIDLLRRLNLVDYRRGSPLLPRITTSPSVIGRLARILFAYKLLHRRVSHRNNRKPHRSFGYRLIECRPIGFPAHSGHARAGGLQGVALLLPRQTWPSHRPGPRKVSNSQTLAQAEEEAARRAQRCSEDDALDGMRLLLDDTFHRAIAARRE